MLERQPELGRGIKTLRDIVGALELDQARLARDLASDTVEQRLAADRAEAEEFGFDGTPVFVINSVSLVGNHPERNFEKVIRLLMPDSRGAQAAAPRNP